MGKAKFAYETACNNARRMITALQSSCHSIIVCGSVRRCQKWCGDIELLCVTKRDTDLFGAENGRPHIEAALQILTGSKQLSPPIKNGDRFKQFELLPLRLQFDLWIVPENEWPVALAIRTGPLEYSKAIVTEKCRGGLLTDGHCIKHNQVWRKGRDGEPIGLALPIESESDFLERFCGGYKYPGVRRYEWRPAS